jgi:O-antigen/teichoic acid export membrane protein
MGAHAAREALTGHWKRRFDFLRLMGSAVGSQALLSAGSFGVGLLLIRRSDNLEYGSYVLASSAILLLASLQNAFFGPVLAMRFGGLDLAGRAALVGALSSSHRRMVHVALAALVAGVIGLRLAGALQDRGAGLALVSAAAAFAILNREFLRIVLLAHRRAHDVLLADLAYVVLLAVGVFGSTLTKVPAMGALAALGVAALVSRFVLGRAMALHAPSRDGVRPGLIREIAPLASWATAGAAIHWSFSQGYVFVVAGALDVSAVAAIAATRLLLMPVNLLSTGIGSLMLPMSSAWLRQHGAVRVLRRLAGFALGMAALTLVYFGLLWHWRDAIFSLVLHKAFAQRDVLLLLWGLIFLVMVVRDQIMYLPASQGRFRAMSLLTGCCAVVSLSTSWIGMRLFGAPWALGGMLLGELLSLLGMALLAGRRAAETLSVPA